MEGRPTWLEPAIDGRVEQLSLTVGVGAGTQALVLIPESIIFGPGSELPRTVFMGAAWVINLAIAELVVRRRRIFTTH